MNRDRAAPQGDAGGGLRFAAGAPQDAHLVVAADGTLRFEVQGKSYVVQVMPAAT